MFWIGVSHNAIGRFYETQRRQHGANGARVDARRRRAASGTARIPDPGDVRWNSRSNVNMQQSALLITLNNVAKNKETFLENYYAKMKSQVNLGKTDRALRVRDAADQRKKSDIADLVNIVRARVWTSASPRRRSRPAAWTSRPATTSSAWISRTAASSRCISACSGIRRTTAPYDDTGWSIPLLHNIKVTRVDDKSILDQPMTTLGANAAYAGSIQGTGSTLVIDHTTTTSSRLPLDEPDGEDVGAEQAFDIGGRSLRAGAFIIREREPRDARADHQGPRAAGVGDRHAPTVPMHDLDCRGSATSTAGRARRTKAGSAWAWTCTRFPTSTSATTKCGRATCARSTT
jgi:hypothetical protein